VKKVTDRRTAQSKYLSYVLRHDPASIGLALGAGGWVKIDDLLARCRDAGHAITREELDDLVTSSQKKRLAISEDGSMIRASQGHSVAVDLELPAVTPPEFLYHGTVARYLPAIRADGLRRMSRHHVHLSPDPETARIVGRRRGAPHVLRIAAGAMHRDGHVFHRADNGAWLTDHVPPNFISDHS
jgi:putative RNA 2'-phosphotransferase